MDGISSYNSFLALHKPQFILSNVPEHFWPTLCKKLQDQIFDAGQTFSLLRIDGEQRPYEPKWAVQCERDVQRSDPYHIYLIDHAWTFKADAYKNQLRNVPGLLERMANMMQTERDVEDVSRQVWRYAQTYSVAGDEFSVEERVPVWYVMDELGSGIPHSDTPNFRMVPFIYVPEQMTYSLLFPIENVEDGDFVTRNFVEGDFFDQKKRNAMLIPWQRYPYFEDDYKQVEPDASYFLEGHIVETLPEASDPPQRPMRKLKVFSEYSFINQYLTSEHFEMVDSAEDADIMWYINHFKQFKMLNETSPNKLVNQFPFEYVITIKDLLAIVGRRHKDKEAPGDLETSPCWLPTTFNLKTELPKLVSYFWKRKEAGLDNNWICKPFNLARGLDTYITDDLNFLCRLPLTGPKIAQKYIENPVLFDRPDCGLVKFDIRYVILLKSVRPTKVYIYTNFFLRFSNKPFALNNFDDYEQHFTVMNYNENAPLLRMLCADFKESWTRQYPNINWKDVEKKICDMIAQLFTAATSVEPPRGIASNPQSRALYAADIMLAWKTKNNEKVMEPQLLEVNWMPDCQRACHYYPQFYNDVFSVLFLDKEVDTCKTILQTEITL